MNQRPPIVPRCPARRRLLRRLATLPALAWLPAAAAEPVLRLGTSTPGGGFSLYGETLARVLAARAGRPLVEAIASRGTEENLQRLAAGELDAALIQGTAASQLLQAPGDPGLRVLFAMYPSPGLLAVPGDSAARRLKDLRGRPVVFGVAASGLVLLARQVFGAIGLDIDRDFQAIYVEQAAQGPQRVLDGAADALWGAGEGWPGFLRLAGSPRGARFLAPDGAQIAAILERHRLLQAMTVEAGAYRGLDRPLPTVGSWNLILARADLPEAAGYRVARALHEAAADLTAALPQAATSTAALLHAGTARLLRELRLLTG